MINRTSPWKPHGPVRSNETNGKEAIDIIIKQVNTPRIAKIPINNNKTCNCHATHMFEIPFVAFVQKAFKLGERCNVFLGRQ